MTENPILKPGRKFRKDGKRLLIDGKHIVMDFDYEYRRPSPVKSAKKAEDSTEADIYLIGPDNIGAFLPPIIKWRGLLVTVTDKTETAIYEQWRVQKILAEAQSAPVEISPAISFTATPQALDIGGSKALIKNIDGILAYPCGSKIYLKDLLKMYDEYIEKRLKVNDVSVAPEDRIPVIRRLDDCIELGADCRLAANPATDGKRFLALLSYAPQGEKETYAIKVFEFDNEGCHPYADIPLEDEDLKAQTRSGCRLCCTERAVYIYIPVPPQGNYRENIGRLLCLDLVSLHLTRIKGRYHPLETYVNSNSFFMKKKDVPDKKGGADWQLCEVTSESLDPILRADCLTDDYTEYTYAEEDNDYYFKSARTIAHMNMSIFTPLHTVVEDLHSKTSPVRCRHLPLLIDSQQGTDSQLIFYIEDDPSIAAPPRLILKNLPNLLPIPLEVGKNKFSKQYAFNPAIPILNLNTCYLCALDNCLAAVKSNF